MSSKKPIEITRSPNSRMLQYMETGMPKSSTIGERIVGKTLDVGYTAVSMEPIGINSPGDDLIFPFENTHIRGDVDCSSITCNGSLRIDGKLICRGGINISGHLIVGDEVYVKKTPSIDGRIFILGKEHGSVRPIMFNNELVIYKDGEIFMFETWKPLGFWVGTKEENLQKEIKKFDATWWERNIYYVLLGYKTFLTQNFLAFERKNFLIQEA